MPTNANPNPWANTGAHQFTIVIPNSESNCTANIISNSDTDVCAQRSAYNHSDFRSHGRTLHITHSSTQFDTHGRTDRHPHKHADTSTHVFTNRTPNGNTVCDTNGCPVWSTHDGPHSYALCIPNYVANGITY